MEQLADNEFHARITTIDSTSSLKPDLEVAGLTSAVSSSAQPAKSDDRSRSFGHHHAYRPVIPRS
jgi:hypothetical protein